MDANRNGCLAKHELILVSDFLLSGRENVEPDAEDAHAKYKRHIAEGCVDCAETVESLLLIYRSASTAMERVISRFRQERESDGSHTRSSRKT